MKRASNRLFLLLIKPAMIEARSQAQSELMKTLWANPNSVFNSKEYRYKMIEYWSNPKNREAVSEAMIEYWSDPKNHKAKSEAMKEYCANRTRYY